MISVLGARRMANLTVTGRPFVTIVSGLPRSGMALMMRMLEAGGLPLLFDNQRQADIDNPLGHYDYEPVKSLASDASWVTLSRGFGVKMVHRLVYHLPPGVEYRVLFMNRNLDEVLASQRSMLERLGKPFRYDDEKMARMFRADLARFVIWIKERSNFRLLEVDYNAIVRDPEPIVAAIDRFLGDSLDIVAMSSTVDPSLYRNRAD